ncbi:MAG: hypothetical protein JW896_07325 [Deltaproteobacteria bacterium]|nr:hypothetical protein [Deltaproteobacteria bacterium]
MKGIFELISGSGSGVGEETVVSIGIPLKAGGHDVMCPISKTCASYRTLEIEVQAIKDELDALLQKAKGNFEVSATEDALALTPDMSPEEIWSVLSKLSQEDLFVQSYNSLEEEKRRAVAEHVLTRCNVFSGMSAVFSSRYNSETGLLE